MTRALLTETVGTTSRVRALGDVSEAGRVVLGNVIEQGVQVAERVLAVLQTNVVEHSNDTGEHGGSARSASNAGHRNEVLDNNVVGAQGGDVGVSTTSGIPLLGRGQVTPKRTHVSTTR